MKKSLVSWVFLIITACGVFAQGQILFQATGANGLITFSTSDGFTSVNYPVSPGFPGFGNASVGFFAAPNGTVLSLGFNGLPNFAGWDALPQVLPIATGPGRTSLTTLTTFASDGAPGVNVELEVVAWTGTATSWAQAVGFIGPTSLLAWSGKVSYVTGIPQGALGWSQPTGNLTVTPAITPGLIVTGAGGYSGLLLAVPEPSVFQLTLFGAGTLGFCRLFLRMGRKKA